MAITALAAALRSAPFARTGAAPLHGFRRRSAALSIRGSQTTFDIADRPKLPPSEGVTTLPFISKAPAETVAVDGDTVQLEFNMNPFQFKSFAPEDRGLFCSSPRVATPQVPVLPARQHL